MYGPNQGIRSFSDRYTLNNEEKFSLLRLFTGFSMIAVISFEEIDSLQRIEKEKRLFSFKRIGANFAMR
jgi:hypothetical protein